MKRTRRRRDFEAEDLNVAPLMNLFVAIVPLLLFSAVFVSLASIDLSAPQRSPAGAAGDDFALVVRLTPSGWWVDARGAASVAVAKGDRDALQAELDRQHAAHPAHTEALVVCEDAVAYEEIVRVLDTAALAGFPDCSLLGAASSRALAAAAGARP